MAVGTGIPGAGGSCSPSGGTGWVYGINLVTGGAPAGVTAVGSFNESGLVMGLTWSKNSDGTNSVSATGSDGSTTKHGVGADDGGGTPTIRRSSWRELFNN